MGIKLFSSSSEEKTFAKLPQHLPNPDPHQFEIKRIKQCGDYLVARVHYPDANNFEGNKVIVFKGLAESELGQKEVLDPHFLEEGKIIARFIPTDEGWDDAVAFATSKAVSSIKNL